MGNKDSRPKRQGGFLSKQVVITSDSNELGVDESNNNQVSLTPPPQGQEDPTYDYQFDFRLKFTNE